MFHTLTIIALLVANVCGGIIGSLPLPAQPIFGGTDAKEGAAPYQVSLQHIGQHFCGGSIIADRWILTTRLCIENTIPCCISVLVGTNDKQSGGSRYDVDRILPYGSWNASIEKNDIALVRLSTPLKISERVKIIKYSTAAFIPDNATLTVTGWGQVDAVKFTNQLQTLDLQHVALDRCRAIYVKEGARNSTLVSEANLCTATRRKSQALCSDDAGSPVIWKGEQVAIVSRLLKQACTPEIPHIHTRVSFYHDWIQKTIANNSD
ncbi:chymotrypsin-1-like [Anopheles maculipalpis]|uniref:chymotrypsin-1-like n=1 Tax=Anopheles maculipalpis TaxID=1496333 RepID=UPI0021591D80|nr:chymotrypsin-1-like [Anopheles maculipalpis]